MFIEITEESQRQFTIVNLLLLTFLISCSLPVTVFFYLQYHWKDLTTLELLRLHLAGLFSNDVLFLKFALDPLIYAWRLAQYRRALKSLLVCKRQRIHIDGVISLSIGNHTLASPEWGWDLAGVVWNWPRFDVDINLRHPNGIAEGTMYQLKTMDHWISKSKCSGKM